MIRSFLASLCVVAASLLPASAAVPLVNLVNDQTLLVISVSDTPGLLRGLESSPVSSSWNDPQIVKFLAPLREQMKIDEWDEKTKEATGLTVRELLALAEGQALFALPAFDFSKFESDTPPPFLIALEVGGQGSKIEKILADSAAKESIKEETETFSGVKVTVRPVTSKPKDADAEDAPSTPRFVAWAIVDGIWLLSAEKESVFAAIDAVKQGGVDAALGKNERFLHTRERAGDAQALVYVNIPAIYPLVRDAVAAQKAKAAKAPNPMGIDPETMLKAFGLDALGEAFASLQVSEKETRMDFGLFYAEERGLLKLVAYQPGPAPQPDWIPAKWPSVSTMRFSLPKAYAGLEELLEEISPMISGMAQGQIRAFNKKTGIDIKRDLVDSLGNEIVTSYALPPGVEPGAVPPWQEMDQLISVSLANEPAFSKSVEALKKLAGPAAEQMFLKREYLGNTLYTLNAPTPPGGKAPRGFTYAIANNTLLVGIGSPATVEAALQGMASAQGLFWKRDDVKAVLAGLPADAVAVQVQDLRVMIASLIETGVQFQEQTAAEQSDGSPKKTFFDVSARPDEETIARHWGVAGSAVIRTGEGLFSTARFPHPQK